MVEGGERGGGAGAHGDDDLFVRDRGAVAGSKYAGDGGLALVVDFNFSPV